MNDWREVTLDELGRVERGRSRHRPRNDPRLYGGSTPFFQTGDVKAAVLHLTEATQYYSEAGLAQSRLWQPGTTCVTIAANIAETAVLGVPGCFPDSVLGFSPHSDPEDAYFVKYLLDVERKRLSAAARGTTQENLSLEKLGKHQFRVPTPAVRRVIVRVLRALDDLIENNGRRIALLERLAQAIYREWFVHFRYPGHEDDELVDSSLGPIPAGWELRELQDIASAVTDTVDPAEIDPETPAVGLEHIPRRSLTLVEWGRADGLASRKARFLTGDVLFGKIRPYFHKVCVAPCDGICSTDAIVIRAIDERFRGLVTMSVFSDGFVAHAVATSNGTKMPRADWKVLRTWNVSVPPERILAAFENAVTDSLDMCRLLAAQGRELATLRDQLLPKLVTGAIDVSHLDLDALLEAPAA